MEHQVPTNSRLAQITYSLRKGPLGLLVGATVLALCAYTIGPENIFQSLRQIRPHLLLSGFICIFFWLLLGAVNIRTMLNPLAKISYGKILNVYSNANMVALIMPGQVGDVIIIKFFKNLDIPLSQGVTLFATDKLITLFWYAFFALYGLYLARLGQIFHLPIQGNVLSLVASVAIIAIVILTLFFVRRHLLAFFSQRIQNWFSLSRSYLRIARKAILLNALITLTRILVLGCAYWVTIKAYGPSPPLMHALCFAVAAGLVAYIPISFNGLGTVEAALVYLYSTTGIESAPVLAMALTMRIIVIIIVVSCAMLSNLLQPNLHRNLT